MEQEYNEAEAYRRARKRVEELKGFYWNLASYCIVIPFLIFINYYTFWGYQWFWWPMFGWGFGLTIHGINVFYSSKFLGREWEERKLREFLEQEEVNRQKYE